MGVQMTGFLLASAIAVQAFVHPGVLNNKFELEYAKAQVAAGAQPWKAAFVKMVSLPEASLAYTPKPRADVGCGSASNPDYGCSDEKRDSQAAYLHALLWAVGGDKQHAVKCAAILDAWSAVLKTHYLSNAHLQAGWTGGPFVRAAEILRSTYPEWGKVSQDRFSAMLTTAFLPNVKDGQSTGTNGNWETVMTETLMSIAVFQDDQALFDKGVALYKRRLPAYIYLGADGPMPMTVDSARFSSPDKVIAHWFGQKKFMDGLSQETCRDLMHTQWGIGGLLNSAEIAWKQGIDLYSLSGGRLLAGMEFHAPFLMGAKVPADLCGGSLGSADYKPMWEVGYNHFHDWMKQPMPNTEALLKKNRPETYDHAWGFGTLSHAGMGASGEVWNGGNIAVRPWRRASAGAASAGMRIFDLRGREIAVTGIGGVTPATGVSIQAPRFHISP